MLAEKLTTAIELGPASTRVRDWADLYVLTTRQKIDRGVAREALNATATFRGTHLVPLSEAIRELVSLRGATYTAYRRSLGADGDLLPERFTDVVEAVVTFADLLTDEADGAARWNPELRRWEPS